MTEIDRAADGEGGVMAWNFDFSQAPRGKWVETKLRRAKGGVRTVRTFVPDRIIVAWRDGKTVTISNWIPPDAKRKGDRGRWNMLGSTEEPVAWMPYPEHPAAGR